MIHVFSVYLQSVAQLKKNNTALSPKRTFNSPFVSSVCVNTNKWWIAVAKPAPECIAGDGQEI